jgi:hypothetical protein
MYLRMSSAQRRQELEWNQNHEHECRDYVSQRQQWLCSKSRIHHRNLRGRIAQRIGESNHSVDNRGNRDGAERKHSSLKISGAAGVSGENFSILGNHRQYGFRSLL